jgi:hypothetical protein
MYEPEKARKWRFRAEVLRSRAARLTDPRAKTGLEDLALKLEAMASGAERVPWSLLPEPTEEGEAAEGSRQGG